jgi:hypothetical protein
MFLSLRAFQHPLKRLKQLKHVVNTKLSDHEQTPSWWERSGAAGGGKG